MVAKPSEAIKLKERTLACSSANPEFRRFFNWMAAAFYNMVASPDAQAGKNGVKVDLTVQDHPKLKAVYV